MTTINDWQGRVGAEWARQWRRTDRSLEPVGDLLVAGAVDAVPTPAAILDVGCGAGATSLRMADVAPGARVLGLDVSADLIDVARQRAAARHPDGRCRFAVADAARFDAAQWDGDAFDLIVSRHGVMFFDDPVGAFTALRGLAAPGAMLTFSCFREAAANEWAVLLSGLVGQPLGPSPAARGTLGPAGGDQAPAPTGPFAFGDPARVDAILAAAGWTARAVAAHDLPYVAGAGADPARDAADFFRHIGPAATALRDAPDDATRTALDQRLGAAMATHVAADRVTFNAAYWIWTARAG